MCSVEPGRKTATPRLNKVVAIDPLLPLSPNRILQNDRSRLDAATGASRISTLKSASAQCRKVELTLAGC